MSQDIYGETSRRLRVAFASVAAAVSLAAMIGCGGSRADSNRTVVRVGGVKVASATLNRWMRTIASEHLLPDPPSYHACIAHHEAIEPGSIKDALAEECRHEYTELKQRALTYLITSRWLIDEAAESGLHPSAAELTRRLEGGVKPSILQNGGASAADERYAVEAELASNSLRRVLGESVPAVTLTEVAAYYRQHLKNYEHPEVRDIYIVEHVPSAGEAARIRREVSTGRRDIRNVGLHELVHERHPPETVPGKIALANAIFRAKPHVLGALLTFDRQYAFFEVVHVAPPIVQPLTQVQASIKARLAAEARQQRRSRLAAAWRRKWTARTDCQPGYVVQQCKQYSGQHAAEPVNRPSSSSEDLFAEL